MDPLTAAAASGMRARMEALDLLANNIANAATAGFKSDRESYNVYLADVARGGATDPEVLPVVERNWTDFTQGTVTATGNPLDLALTGPGFFSVEAGEGTLYTRNGNFRLSPKGRLETKEGYAVLGQKGKPIVVDAAKQVDISPEGIIRQDGAEVNRLAVVDFAKSDQLSKRGGTYFQLLDKDLKASAAPEAGIAQGRLEASNVGTAESAVRLVSVMRQFEMLQRAMALGGEMNKKAFDEVARVNG